MLEVRGEGIARFGGPPANYLGVDGTWGCFQFVCAVLQFCSFADFFEKNLQSKTARKWGSPIRFFLQFCRKTRTQRKHEKSAIVPLRQFVRKYANLQACLQKNFAKKICKQNCRFARTDEQTPLNSPLFVVRWELTVSKSLTTNIKSSHPFTPLIWCFTFLVISLLFCKLPSAKYVCNADGGRNRRQGRRGFPEISYEWPLTSGFSLKTSRLPKFVASGISP
jgi:hypothetical protein